MSRVVTLLMYCTGAASDVDWMIEIQGDRTKYGRFEGIIGIYDENNPRWRQTNPSDVAIDVSHASEESRTLSCIFARTSEDALHLVADFRRSGVACSMEGPLQKEVSLEGILLDTSVLCCDSTRKHDTSIILLMPLAEVFL
jgi:hypothetical protein